MKAHWSAFSELYAHLAPPLCPTPNDVASLRDAIASCDDDVLLLGMTPALADLGRDLTAVDMSWRMVNEVWPGDGGNRRALVSDWLALPFADATFSAVIGDGAPNSVARDLPALMSEVRRVLRPGGVAAFRLFCAPQKAETLCMIRQHVFDGWDGNFHALKWRLAMALAANSNEASVPVANILQAFDTLFPDRVALMRATGWTESEIATIDFYNGARHSMGFPTLGMISDLARGFFGKCVEVPAFGYPLAERCPILVLRDT